MRRPLFAVGKSHECVSTQVVPTGATSIPVGAAAAADFSRGQVLFVSDADGANVECLGPILQIQDGTLQTAYALRREYSEGAGVWAATHLFQWPALPVLPAPRVFHSGIEVDRSVGGVVHSTRIAEPCRIDLLSGDRLSAASLEALQQWLNENVQGGLLDFSYVDDAGVVNRARLLSPDLKVRRRDEQLLELTLELLVLAEGDYVA